ncbi:MAG: fumarylacetoacetase [Proteobacteria bacterium]|nr:fumarylacetoacetase [Pseudomonadota bacterium]
MTLDATHDAALTSWVESANAADTDFPIQNLPIGMFRRRGSDAETFRPGVAIGNRIVDLNAAAAALPTSVNRALAACAPGELNAYMAEGRALHRELRVALSEGLSAGSEARERIEPALVAQAEAEYAVPCRIGDYTDFYTGIHHATTVGKLFRPDNPLLPNYKWVPIGYHGRSSSIGATGQRFLRPLGQLKSGADAPQLGPSQRMDYELEVGIFVSRGNPPGSRIAMEHAEDHVMGLVLLNDWSARDVQAWEYQPLGPFLSKNFATTISPWIVTLDALEPFRAPWTRPDGDPQPLPYLDSAANRAHGAFDIVLEVWLQTDAMLAAGHAPVRLTSANFRDAYWTVAQMVAHHTVGGCNLQSGDLFGSGTQSGPEAGQGGSLLELSSGGREPVVLPNGERRTFLQDGDTIVLRAHCRRDGCRRIGFGDCAGTLMPALAAG